MKDSYDEVLMAINARLQQALNEKDEEKAWDIINELSSKLPEPEERHILAIYGCPKAE